LFQQWRAKIWAKVTTWIDSLNEWIDSDLYKTTCRRETSKKIDMHQKITESIQTAHNECWYHSKQCESIQSKSETYDDTIHVFLRKIRVNRFIHVMSRFTQSQRLLWYDSDMYESIHAEKCGILTTDMERKGRLETHIRMGALKYSKVTSLYFKK